MTEAMSRAERKQHTRALLLDAARRRAAEQGCNALAVRELTREAGIVPTAFYRHFETVDALAAEVTGQAAAALHELVDALVAAPDPVALWPGLLAAAGRRDPAAWSILARGMLDTAHPTHPVVTGAMSDARRRLGIALSRAGGLVGLDADRVDAATDVLAVELLRAPAEAAAEARTGAGGGGDSPAARRCARRLELVLRA